MLWLRTLRFMFARIVISHNFESWCLVSFGAKRIMVGGWPRRRGQGTRTFADANRLLFSIEGG